MGKKDLLQNIVIGLVLFGLVFGVYFVTENLTIVGITLILWLIYMLYMGYTVFLKKEPNTILLLVKRMEKANKYGKFDKDCVVLADSLQVLNFRKEFFAKTSESSIQKAFNLLEQQILHNAEIAITYMENYNYDAIRNEQSIERLAGAIVNCAEATRKLRDLYETVVKVDDSVSNVDLSYVDNLLESLKDITTDENI